MRLSRFAPFWPRFATKCSGRNRFAMLRPFLCRGPPRYNDLPFVWRAPEGVILGAEAFPKILPDEDINAVNRVLIARDEDIP